MTRIIVYGDSHIGAFKDGWEQIRADFPGVGVEFFGLPHPHVRDIKLLPDGTITVPRTEDGSTDASIDMARRLFGRSEIDAGSADLVIWAGYRWPSVELAGILGEMAVDGVFEADRPRRMSRALFDACVGALAAGAPPRQWVRVFGKRLMFALRANPSETCLAMPPALERTPWERLAAGHGDARPAFAALSEAVRQAALESGLRCLPQPAETLTPSGLTAGRWSRGSRRLVESGKRHNTEDYVHMNGAYGALCLAEVLRDVPGRAGSAGVLA